MSNPNWLKVYQAYYFPSKDNQRPKVDYWKYQRRRAKEQLSASAQLKLEWIIFYNTQANKNVQLTAQHFGITRKTVHKWLKRFKEQRLEGLEEKSCAPHHVRTRQITLEQRVRVKSLRKNYPRYGKMKLICLYNKQHRQKISSWKIQKIIEEGNLYYDKAKASKLRKRQVQARIHAHQRISKLVKERKVNYLWHVDTVILTLSLGGYRYLLTAIDEVSKLAFARLYTTHSSRNSRDFLERLIYLTDRKVINISIMTTGQSSRRSLSRPAAPLLYHSGTPGLILQRTMQYLKDLTEPFRKSL